MLYQCCAYSYLNAYASTLPRNAVVQPAVKHASMLWPGSIVPNRVTQADLEGLPPLRYKLSKLLAIGLAWSLGAREIRLYGDDMHGTADFDGTPAGDNRSDERWEREERQTEAAAEWIHKNGGRLIRT